MVLAALGLGGLWYVSHHPGGTDTQLPFLLGAWPELRGDLQAVALAPAKVRVDLSVFSRDQNRNSPVSARYLVTGDATRGVRVSGRWTDRGVAVRPPRTTLRSSGLFFPRSRPGYASTCSEKLAQSMPVGRRVESTTVQWTDPTAGTARLAEMTLWRERSPDLLRRLFGSARLCVESTRRPLNS